MKLTDRIGAILVIAAKPRIQSSVRSALTARYGRVLTAETVQEARRAVEREKIALMVIFSPLKEERSTAAGLGRDRSVSGWCSASRSACRDRCRTSRSCAA